MRKLATAAAVSLALASGGVFGLGLGDIEMRSALNQPMDAEIRLTSVKPGELDGMIVQLAPQDAFARAGIERSQVLTDLSFSVDTSNGAPIIRISSNRPVVEPFLNFLLEVDWPQGRMVREYTVLLDPPVFMTPSATERNDAADTPAIVERGEEVLVVPTPIQRDSVAAEAAGQVDGELVELEPLDELSDSQLLSESNATAESVAESTTQQGEVISLSDLGAPNTQAAESRAAEAVSSFNIDDVEVGIEGDVQEISDDVFINEAGEIVRQGADTAEGELVELGDLEDGSSVVLSNEQDGSSIVSLDDLDAGQTAGGANASDATRATEVEVASGDTLFEIAESNAAPGASVQQMMLALLAANESSFINGNINLVKAGAILRIPDADEASRLTQTQALAAIGEQNQLWQEYRDSLRSTAATEVAQVEPVQVDTVEETSAEATAGQSDTAEGTTDAIETAALDAENQALEGLSEEARAILETAREEVRNREELRIVADNETSSTTASATADETGDNTAERLGEVNRQLQLTREELASANLRTTDLNEQVAELDGTAQNLDTLVELRQNEIARLEAQLAEVRDSEAAAEAAEQASLAEAAEGAADGVVAEAGDALNGAVDTAEAGLSTATDAAKDAVDSAGETMAAAADDASNTLSDATDAAENAVQEVTDSGTNALLEAGDTLAEVELLSPDTEDSVMAQSDADTTDASTAETQTGDAAAADQKTWYQNFLEDPKRMMIAGIGAVGLFGVLGTLLFRRKRKEPEDDGLLGATDLDEFEAHAPAQPDMTSVASDNVDIDSEGHDGSGSFGAAAAGAAGAAAIGAVSMDSSKADEDSRSDFLDDSASDSTLAFGNETLQDLPGDSESDDEEDDLDKDDTISEADVYLAYGLHGQAEELLNKAIEGNPNNEAYVSKLLQTHHAQNNAEGYRQTAEQYHARFGGSANPAWGQIAAMGLELSPGDSLYSSAQESISAVGGGTQSDTLEFDETELPTKLRSDDVDLNATGSISRDFSAGEDAVDFDQQDADLLDQSLDPAFAFNEGDLEATGDFSQIANELATENEDGSLEFPGLETTGTAANETLDKVLPEIDEPLTLDELDGLGESVDDLTLDLDQLSGDLDLDSAELLNADLSDLDIPELTAENDLLNDGTGGELDSSGDEMETMMDLAKAYIDMGDKDSASSALGEIVKSGSPEQVTEAETLLRKIS